MTLHTNQFIEENLRNIRMRITNAALRYGRQPETIELLAVSKTQSADHLRSAYALGQTQFGENYLQEAVEKIATLDNCQINWHFIGAIQSNKTKTIANYFSWVHSIDRFKIAQRLNDARPPTLPPLNVCLQINISEETSKSGLILAELPDLAKQVMQLPNLTLRGLMALPAASNDFNQQRANFARIRHAFDALNQHGLGLDTLSMGMSNDLEAAIAEGATLVRIGSAIFGVRK